MDGMRQLKSKVFQPLGPISAVGSLILMAVAVTAGADEVRYYQQDGITYRETRRVIQRPIVETRFEQREQVFYREQYKTDMQQSYRTVQVPVTEYRTMACLQNRWNPFAQPYYTYRTVPTLRYQTQQQLVQTPVTRRELVPEKRVVQVPVTSQRMAQEEQITRVAVTSVPAGTVIGSAGSTLSGPIGGVARLDGPSATAAKVGAVPQSSTFTPFTPSPATLANPSSRSSSPAASVASRQSATLAPSSSVAPSGQGVAPQTLSPQSTARPATSPAATIPGGSRY